MKGDDDILEKYDMFFSQRNSKSTDNAGQNVQKFTCSIEFVDLVDKNMEAVSNSLPDHFSPWNQLGVESVENIL